MPLAVGYGGGGAITPVLRRGSPPAPADAGLGVLGWMLLGMPVAPATVAMENTSLVKFPAIFTCPSLSWGESLVSGEPGTAGSAPGRLPPPRWWATACAGPGFSRLFLHGKVLEDPKWGFWGSMAGMHVAGGAGCAMPCRANWLIAD